MSAYSEYLAAMKASGNPEQFAKEYISPTEQAAFAARQEMPKTQVHNATPVRSDLKNYVAPKGTINRESQYYKAGEQARAAGTNKFGAGGTYGTKPKAAPVFEDLIKDSPSADEVDNATMKSHQYYRTQVEQMLGHPVNALSDEQVKQIYLDKTGDESPYLNTGSDNPYYTPLMAEIDNAGAATASDRQYTSQAESERTRDSSAYWDANRPEVHNAKALPPRPVKMETPAGDVLRNGFNALFNYNGDPTAVPDNTPSGDYYYAGRSGNRVYSTYDEPVGPAAPTATQNYGNYYDGRSGNSVYTRYDEPVGPPAPSADPNSPVSTYQQNQNAGVSGFTGNPQTNPEAAALLQEYDNRMAAHGSQPSRQPASTGREVGETLTNGAVDVYAQMVRDGVINTTAFKNMTGMDYSDYLLSNAFRR